MAGLPPEIDPQTLEVESYQRDFEVSAETAKRNLITQQRGAGLVDTLKAVQGKEFAGVWFDNESGEFVVPIVASADKRSIDRALVDSNIAGKARTEQVQYTWQELEEDQQRLNEKVRAYLKEGLTRTSLDPRTNAVVLNVAAGANKLQSAEVQAAAQDAATSIELRPVEADTLAMKNTICEILFKMCSRPLRGGVGIKKGGNEFGPECTAGFKAIGNTFGNRFMLTAGHCVVLGKTYKWYAEAPGITQPPAIGLAEGTNYPGGDWTAINANGSYWDQGAWPSQVAFWNSNEETPIEAESASYLGEYVCHAGLTTGGHCGSVVDLNVTNEGSGGLQEHLAMFGPTCANEGDSGGPVFAGHIALGLLSAGLVHGCGSDYALYAEITEATDALAVSVGPRLGARPFVESRPPTNVQGTSATFMGILNPHGITSNFAFEYGPTTGYGSASTLWGAGSGWQTVPIGGPITGLEPLATYHYRVRAENAAGISYSGDEEFSTPSAPPVAVTGAATAVEQREATLNGSVNPRGASTSYRFEYGPTTSYGTSIPVPSENVGAGRIPVSKSLVIKGLQPGETYHYRLAATNSFGESGFGVDQQFTMKPAPPDVVTKAATGVAEIAATLNGTVNPNGAATTYFFEYGPTIAYGSKTTEVNMGTGTHVVAQSAALEALQQSVVAFHYRIVASNFLGATYGADEKFNPGWKIQPAATPEGSKRSLLAGISCSATSACTAVGNYTNGAGVQLPLAGRWDGAKWTLQSPLNPEGATTATLNGVACTSATLCSAVGNYVKGGGARLTIAEQWNGTKWTIQSTPNPIGALESGLESVSCTASTNCLAAGYYYSPSTILPLTLSWNGTAWVLQPVSLAEGASAGFFNSVSCSSATSCIAVGTQFIGSHQQVLAEQWNGSKWEVRSMEEPEGAQFSTLRGVSCTSSTACTAVGSYITKAGATVTLAERWNGSKWAIQSSPNPAGNKEAALQSVSCASSTECHAVGSFKNASGVNVTLSERWDGTQWEAMEPQNVGGAKASSLSALSCSAATACQAVGYSEAASSVSALAESYSRTMAPTAVTKAATNVTASGAVLKGLINPNGSETKYFFEYGLTTAYGSKTALTNAGSGTNAVEAATEVTSLQAGSTYHYRVVATNSITGTGSDLSFTTPTPSWKVQAAPSPGGAKGATFNAVSCTSTTACTATGNYTSSAGVKMTLAEQWNGSKWEIQTTPNPEGAKESTLESVSCTSPANCVAVGYFVNSSSLNVPMAMRWNGSKWEMQSVPTAAGSVMSWLNGVSCSSATSCVAVGALYNGSFQQQTLAEHWNGTKWEVKASAEPEGAQWSTLRGVSCTSSEACTAAGSYITKAGATVTLAERWIGTKWELQVTPNPEGAKETTLQSVSCASLTACSAVGIVRNGTGVNVTLAERWNGTNWEIQATPNPEGAKETLLRGVSCASTSSCSAVGLVKNSSGANVTLAERWNGTNWEIQSTPNPEGAKASALGAIACSTGVTCEATGSYVSGAGANLPLAMGMQ